jgi:hypothetical protein
VEALTATAETVDLVPEQVQEAEMARQETPLAVTAARLTAATAEV